MRGTWPVPDNGGGERAGGSFRRMFRSLIMAIAPHDAGLSHDRKFEEHVWTIHRTDLRSPQSVAASALSV